MTGECAEVRIHSFAPLSRLDARVLVLGSIPGKVSLATGQYYAHARNQFWSIICELLGIDLQTDYSSRAAAVIDARIAVWDVIQSCHRSSSLDADIKHESVIVNDFAGFFRDYPRVRHVFFNGLAASSAYGKHVQPTPDFPPLQYHQLPSTSPAHAAKTYQQKLHDWQALKRALQD